MELIVWALLIGIIVWLGFKILGGNSSGAKIVDINKHDLFFSRDYSRTFKIDDFMYDQERNSLGKPICPNCTSQFDEFPKSSKICDSCKEKLSVQIVNNQPLLLTSTRKTELRLMKELCNQGRHLDLNYSLLLPSNNFQELSDKIWSMLNQMISSNDFGMNIEIRKYQYLVMMKQGKTNGESAHILMALLSDYSIAINNLSRNGDKSSLSHDVASFLYNSNYEYLEVLKDAKNYNLEYELEKERIGIKGIKILSCCCENCNVETRDDYMYSIKEIKKTLPLPHKTCSKLCSCIYLAELKDY